MSSPSARFFEKSSDLLSKMATKSGSRSTISLPVPSLLASLKSGESENERIGDSLGVNCQPRMPCMLKHIHLRGRPVDRGERLLDNQGGTTISHLFLANLYLETAFPRGRLLAADPSHHRHLKPA